MSLSILLILFRYISDMAYEAGVSMNDFKCLEEVDDARLVELLDSTDLTLTDQLGQSVMHLAAQYLTDRQVDNRNQLNLEIRVPDWLITSHVT